MTECNTLVEAIAQNLSAIIAVLSSLISAITGGVLTILAQKSKVKSEMKMANHKEKISAYNDLLSACQEIRCLAKEYASCDHFPSGENERDKEVYETILHRYCSLVDNLKEASVKIRLYGSEEIVPEVCEFFDKIYDDFILYLKSGKTQLSNDTGNKDSKLQAILEKIDCLVKMLRDDVQK